MLQNYNNIFNNNVADLFFTTNYPQSKYELFS